MRHQIDDAWGFLRNYGIAVSGQDFAVDQKSLASIEVSGKSRAPPFLFVSETRSPSRLA